MDVQELINEASKFVDLQVWSEDLVKRLVDALDALNGENEELTEGMTTEMRARRLALDPKGKIIAGRLVLEKRTVGPWVEVSS